MGLEGLGYSLKLGASLVVLWLRLCFPNARTWVQSLVRELVPPAPTKIASLNERPTRHNEDQKIPCAKVRPSTAK